MDSDLDRNEFTHRYPTRASIRKRISEDLSPERSKAKKLRPTRSNKRNNVDKEDDICLADRLKIKPPFGPTKRTSKSTNPRKNSSKLPASQDRLKSKVQLDPDHKWYSQRTTGLWVQCCRDNCGKWRYNDRFHDPLNVPEIWYCDMHHDPHLANCDYPQEEFTEEREKDFIENEYTAGSIVWAHLRGYPWWPAMVDDNPSTLTFYELGNRSNVPTKYNVTWFEEDNARFSSIPVKELRPYKTNPKDVFLKRKKMTFRGNNFKDQVYRASEIADKAVPLSIYQRLEMFSLGLPQTDTRENSGQSDRQSEVSDEEGRNETTRLEVSDEEGRNETTRLEVSDEEGRNETTRLEVSDEEGRNETTRLEVSDEEGRNETTRLEVSDEEGINQATRLEVSNETEDQNGWHFPHDTSKMTLLELLRLLRSRRPYTSA